MNMAGESLPEELVLKIVAMMPFPSIFKARLLSKSWQAIFRSIQSQDDQKQRSRAISFQRQVTESSNRWGTFGHPYSLDGGSTIYFHQILGTGQRMPSLSFLPEKLFQEFVVKYTTAKLDFGDKSLNRLKTCLQIEGPLLYGMLGVYPLCCQVSQELYVANILTQEYKKLPARPFIFDESCCFKLVIETSAQTYKLILICKRTLAGEAGESSVQIYDSEANNWSCQGYLALSRLYDAESLSISAYFNGVLYMSAYDDVDCLLAYNLEGRSSTVIRLSTWTGLPSPADILYADESKLVVCDGSLMMIVTEAESSRCYKSEFYTVRVLKIDVEAQLVMEVAHWRLVVNRSTDIPVSQDNHKFFGVSSMLPHLVLVYDERTKEWSYFHPKKAPRLWSVSFQPGLSTFMAV